MEPPGAQGRLDGNRMPQPPQIPAGGPQLPIQAPATGSGSGPSTRTPVEGDQRPAPPDPQQFVGQPGAGMMLLSLLLLDEAPLLISYPFLPRWSSHHCTLVIMDMRNVYG